MSAKGASKLRVGGLLAELMYRIEMQLIREALWESNGNQSAAAHLLGISRSAISRKISTDNRALLQRAEASAR